MFGRGHNTALRRPRRRSHLAIVGTATILASLFAVLPSSSARAFTYGSNGMLEWPDTAPVDVFGPNSAVTIDFGQLDYIPKAQCSSSGKGDLLNITADVYVIPVKNLPALLADPKHLLAPVSVNNQPSATILADLSGTFFSQTIGYTAPAGSLEPGQYAVVYDECQDGALGAQDELFSPTGYPASATDQAGLDVVFTPGVPVPPSGPIVAAKQAATQFAKDALVYYLLTKAMTEVADEVTKWRTDQLSGYIAKLNKVPDYIDKVSKVLLPGGVTTKSILDARRTAARREGSGRQIGRAHV